MKRLASHLIFGITAAVSFQTANAATGIYLTGYGAQEQGMGGATIAVGQSAMAAATNPAGMAFVGQRFDVGFGALLPESNTEANGVNYKVKKSTVPFLELGYNHPIDEKLSLGISVWSAGGGTDYGAPFGGIPSNSATSSQGVFIHAAPTISYKIGQHHAFALSLVGGLSTFNLEGIEAQSGQSNPGREDRKSVV